MAHFYEIITCAWRMPPAILWPGSPALSLRLDPLKVLQGSSSMGMITRITLHQPELYLVQGKTSSGTWPIC